MQPNDTMRTQDDNRIKTNVKEWDAFQDLVEGCSFV